MSAHVLPLRGVPSAASLAGVGADSARSTFSATESEVGAAGPAVRLREDGRTEPAARSAEDEDELGVAKNSRYHQREYAQQSKSRGHGQGSPAQQTQQQQQQQQSFSQLRRAGGSTAHDDDARDIGHLDSMPFAPGQSPRGAQQQPQRAQAQAAAGMGANHPLSPSEARMRSQALQDEKSNHFAMHASQQPLSSRSSARSALADELADAAAAGDLSDEQRRREWKRSQEAKEEAQQYERVRGGALSDFAGLSLGAGGGTSSRGHHAGAPSTGHFGTLLGSGPVGHASAALAASAAAVAAIQPVVKPYVRYTPKYNLPYGDAPRQQAPPPSAAQLAAESKSHADSNALTDAVNARVSSAGASGGSDGDLAQVRNTTLFNLSGALHTHVGISLNPAVFTNHSNEEHGGNFVQQPVAGRRSAGTARPGSSTSGGASVGSADQQTAAAATASQSAFPPWLQMAVPALAFSALPPGVRAKSAGDRNPSSRPASSATAAQASVSGDGAGDDADGTFLTGVPLTEAQVASAEAHSQALVAAAASAGDSAPAAAAAVPPAVVTVEDVRAFDQLRNLEKAVAYLPRLLAPRGESIEAVRALGARQVRHRAQQALLPPLPFLSLPSRVNLPEIMSLALHSLSSDPAATAAAAAAANQGGGSTTAERKVRAREEAFKSYFFSPPSQQIIKDSFYFVLLYFFRHDQDPSSSSAAAGGSTRKADQARAWAQGLSTSSTTNEMFLYRSYADTLSRYANQEGFLKRQREWVAECERLKQEQKDAHMQIGTQASAMPGGQSQSSGSNLGGKDDLTLPPAPVQSAKAKRAPLVLLGDIAPFDVAAKLNTGPVPKGLFALPGTAGAGAGEKSKSLPGLKLLPGGSSSPSSSSGAEPDYSSPEFVLSSLRSRISSTYVRLFLTLAPQHKDYFYQHYADCLAQVIFYSCLVCYNLPESRALFNHAFFKVRLLQLTSFWVVGFVPSTLEANLRNWRGDIQFITGERGVRKEAKKMQRQTALESGDSGEGDQQETQEEGAQSRLLGSAGGGSDDDDGPFDAHAELAAHNSSSGGFGGADASAGEDSAFGGNSGTGSTAAPSSVAPSHPSSYVSQLEKKLNAHLAASSKTARQARQAQQAQAQLQQAPSLPQFHHQHSLSQTHSSPLASSPPPQLSSSPSPVSSATPPPPVTAASPVSPPVRRGVGITRADMSPSAQALAQLSSTSVSLTGDLLVDVGVRPVRTSARVPLRVQRRKVELHHSALVQDFLDARHFGRQSNHAVRVPISVPVVAPPGSEIASDSTGAFLDQLAAFNESRRAETAQLKVGLEVARAQCARQNWRQHKELGEIARRHAQERERALREAPAFSRALVAEHQERRYQELKAPSKSLALRRLGHFRQTKEDGTGGGSGAARAGLGSEVSATLTKAGLTM